MEEGLIEINIETIKQLRFEGDYEAAEMLLEAYHKNKKLSKIQDYKDMINMNNRIKRHILKNDKIKRDSKKKSV